MVTDQLKEFCRERFDKMEQRLQERRKPEEYMSYLHDSEDRSSRLIEWCAIWRRLLAKSLR